MKNFDALIRVLRMKNARRDSEPFYIRVNPRNRERIRAFVKPILHDIEYDQIPTILGMRLETRTTPPGYVV